MLPDPAQTGARAPASQPNPNVNLWQAHLHQTAQRARLARPVVTCGKLTRVAGLVMEAVGLKLPVGSACRVELPYGRHVLAEVVGFAEERAFLMPQTDLVGVVPGARVFPLEPQHLPLDTADPTIAHSKFLPVGPRLLGRVVDANGEPLDGKGPLGASEELAWGSLAPAPLNPLKRKPIERVLDVGVRAINGLLTVGQGQRLGLFAGSGVGKSVLLGMMARYTQADVVVVGLIGERGREVKEFIDEILGDEGLARSAVVAAPADNSPLMRLQGAAYAHTIAEYFRDRGCNVLLIVDSLTRYAMAQREIALAIGEPPATKGYPPSAFAKLPALVERAGNGMVDAAGRGGSITAFYTVLAEGDDQQDPIADAARAILDGHFVLSRKLAEQGHYPAIDIEQSISRVMSAIVPREQLDAARRFKQLYARYQRNRDLIAVGAYARGSDPVTDQAIARYPSMEGFLQQGMFENESRERTLEKMNAVLS
ncbi:flagellar protein export ATPase FliI [Ralstonia pseudosolanacearum]|uniref:Flagellum-specific ATP synthase n=1 Tax=Ralstonia nicotianae (strain ATCC BAA-1114 / GMI1000) TaxID=267608 RepID=Q8XSS4_RALN1|nr:flagellar protein export ATPase FliI [Ralstonia pseudosolanacearum]AST29439.1 flagellum-specific ATP synthase FliI [Ralstonia pseudosolanacearum]MDC6283380.1 flagellar protein export ATPase FliI [Ralstonia pseudosolanacearum]MDO3507558.1 flagellar protein export ATPase FliI [Ralstonia pseudosolanacearum]MDO3512022.1 flagellar protein export ATPase FliI [Ralstonia pseudosolanacearum]MDO3536888.1 flagellar protein export ATPase FliI [Ralstonia pseudosolanacearum]